ncbi:hypothetical protein F3087_11360 [Nocardia colli]|uniref:Uncharacterized protein n=1 Tax=Nocardia colli TaxID=2545717 RepID=A0A5N0EL78_9NOCA|nr:hypothetical protein [Nocardia colli]KAA8889509.1 hypothetical protein F3087_11360 [Nocardia colli]
MTTIPTRDEADYAEQLIPANPDRAADVGLDTTALTPPTEHLGGAFDTADLADRYEQSLIIPIPDDDYPLAY